MQEVKKYFDKKSTYFQTYFYIAQRGQRNILLNANGQPEGAQWSDTMHVDKKEKYLFDAEHYLKDLDQHHSKLANRW